jgi:hypothetical protein
MRRLDECPKEPELRACAEVLALGSAIEDVCYYGENQGIPEDTQRILAKTARVIRDVATYYKGDDTGLVWQPPTGRFTKGKK